MEHVLDYRDQRHQLEKDGIIHIPNFFPRELIFKIANKIENYIEERSFISRVRNTDFETPEEIEKGIFQFFVPKTIKDPSFPLKENTKGVHIKDPLLNLRDLVGIVFDERLIGIASSYFQVIPILSFLKVMCSFVNSLPESTDTQLFHIDTGSFRILKAFIYLNDVNAGVGPFEYVKGSLLTKFEG